MIILAANQWVRLRGCVGRRGSERPGGGVPVGSCPRPPGRLTDGCARTLPWPHVGMVGRRDPYGVEMYGMPLALKFNSFSTNGRSVDSGPPGL